MAQCATMTHTKEQKPSLPITYTNRSSVLEISTSRDTNEFQCHEAHQMMCDEVLCVCVFLCV